MAKLYIIHSSGHGSVTIEGSIQECLEHKHKVRAFFEEKGYLCHDEEGYTICLNSPFNRYFIYCVEGGPDS